MKLYAAGVFLICLATVIDIGSRGAILGFLAFLALMLFRRPKNLKYLPLVLVALPLLWLGLPKQYKARYETIATRDQDDSYTNRLLSWQGGVKMFLHNPITGIGPDNYTDANGAKYWPGYPRHWLNAHSLYFKLLGELGILGIITFFVFVFSVMRMNLYLARLYRKKIMDPVIQRFPSACNQCYILMLFCGYASHNTYRSNWYTLAAVTAALALLRPAGDDSDTETQVPPAQKLPAWVPARHEPDAEPVTVG